MPSPFNYPYCRLPGDPRVELEKRLTQLRESLTEVERLSEGPLDLEVAELLAEGQLVLVKLQRRVSDLKAQRRAGKDVRSETHHLRRAIAELEEALQTLA